MKKLSLSFVGALALLALSSCVDVIDVKDGHVPAELLDAAHLWAGSYTGPLHNRVTDLTISFDGDRPVITSNHDLAGFGCNSHVGNLVRIEKEKGRDGDVVGKLTFNFEPNFCFGITGREVSFEARMDGNKIAKLHMSYLDKIVYRERCEWVGGGYVGNPPVPVHGHLQCWTEPDYVYVDAFFKRTQ